MKQIIKKLTILLLTGMMLISCSDKLQYSTYKMSDTRTEIKFKRTSIQVDNTLLPYVIEFIEESYKNGVDIETISNSYLGIFCDETPNGTVGITVLNYPDKSYTLIDCDNNKSANRLRLIVFHEMGHKYIRLEHCHRLCDQIMSSISNNKAAYGDWESKKEIFFKNIKHDGINE